MRSDGPTLPNLGWSEPDTATGSGTSSDTPTWPLGGERLPQVPGSSRPPKGYVSATTLLGVSLGANVVLLIGLVGLLLLGHAGMFAPSGPAGLSTPGETLSSPTATTGPTPPVSSWLRVAPSSVSLGCDGSQRTQFAVLQNSGPQRVHWQASVVGSPGQAGVAINPNQGDLDAGASLPVQLQDTTHSSGPQGISSQQGVIRFVPTSLDAGSPPGLSYTTVGCS
jgi:hypothetical protein